jgi:hypothetical protein
MRRRFCILCLILTAYGAFAQSLTLTGGIDNFMFDNKNNAPNTFQAPYLMTALYAGIDGNFTTFSRYRLAFTVDPVLLSLLHGDVTFNLWFFKLGIGSFLSMFNEGEDEYVPGMTGSLGMEAAGVFSVSLEYGLNVFTDLTKIGNTNLNFGNIEILFWIPNVIVRLNMQRKSFTHAQSKEYTIKNALLCYRVVFDMFSKSSPLVVTIGGELKTTEKVVEPIGNAQVSKLDNSINGIFFIAGLSLELNSVFDFILNAEIPIAVSAPGGFFMINAGFKIKLGDN